MKQGKEGAHQHKRIAKAKRHRRIIKRQHLVRPAILGGAAISMLLGSTIALLSFSTDAVGLGALIGTWLGLLVLVPLIYSDLMRLK
jgi:uncharacterized membrane protein YcjF (UPF0283 family)